PHRRAVECFTGLSPADKQQPRYLYYSAQALANQGTFFARTNEFDKAEKACTQAIQTFRQLTERHRTAWLFREALAVSLAAQADTRNAAQRSREAEEPAREAAALALEQLRDFPNYPMARRNYARHLWTLANTLSFLRRHEEAEQFAAEALDVA